ncbi:hypothetical protein [Oceanibaculum pacificum]|uniref:Uncharacterized protein n=1 Tax=Oceanibaculum pacificum TaxID=580166 RepID=A0A154WFA6_9PROT|nr:hypothetical protein [Oceanibaculum pacificum]KZD12179.1 hypothetical protein AUP43_05070 [Oceanibaculum pacificum]
MAETARRPAWVDAAVAGIMLLLWALAALEVASGWRAAGTLAGAVALLLALWGAVSRGGVPRLAAIVFGGTGFLLLWRSGAWGDGMAALEKAARFTAFVTCLHLLRTIVLTEPLLARVQDGFIALRPQAKNGALQILSTLFSLPLGIGAISVIAPFVTREEDPAARLEGASWTMRGMAHANLFSPFTVAMGMVASCLPLLDLPVQMGAGLALAVLMILATHALGQCRLPRHLPASFWRAFAGVMLPVTLIVAVNITAIFALGLTTVQSATLVVPASALVLAGIAALSGPALAGRGLVMARMIRQTAAGTDGETAVFVAALCFAAGVTATPEITEAIRRLAPVLGPEAMIVATLVGIAGVSSMGLHMVVPTTVLLTLFGPAMPDATHMTLLALAALIGWSFGAIASMGSISFLICAKLFEVPARRLAFGRNLRFMLALSAGFSAGVLLLV